MVKEGWVGTHWRARVPRLTFRIARWICVLRSGGGIRREGADLRAVFFTFFGALAGVRP